MITDCPTSSVPVLDIAGVAKTSAKMTDANAAKGLRGIMARTL